jgi:hypothetical protein
VKAWIILAPCALIGACGSSSSSSGGDSSASDGGAHGADGGTYPLFGDSSVASGDDGGAATEQPATCAEAASVKSYVGCEFWPTVVFNPVWSVFDFAAVVANAGTASAQVTVDRGGTAVTSATVAPGDTGVLYLPWVPDLKGGDFDGCTSGARPTASVLVQGGAYHLTSTVPVTVWQFSPLEYKAGTGGPSGKDWTCPYAPASCNGNGVDCLSVNNDASLLLPTAAMTGNYRLFGKSATTYGSSSPPADDQDSPGAFAITATQDDTHVTVSLVAGASIAAGTGVTATSGGGSLALTLGAGDVVELVGTRGASYGSDDSDLSGSVATSDQPIQIIAFNAITDMPSPLISGGGWADHLEETVLPAESLGSHYLVAPPTDPSGTTSQGHYVRFYGNRDGTTLTYPSGSPPAGAPTTLDAGQVVDIPTVVTEAFEVQGSYELAIASIMLGSQLQDPTAADPQGDPSLTFVGAVEQFRHSYVFLAPSDYAASYADVLVPTGATVSLDGQPLTGTSSAIGSSGWSIVRATLVSGNGSSGHTLTSDQAVGLQIMGFGHATSYYTPGGYNLNHIAPPPTPPR